MRLSIGAASKIKKPKIKKKVKNKFSFVPTSQRITRFNQDTPQNLEDDLKIPEETRINLQIDTEEEQTEPEKSLILEKEQSDRDHSSDSQKDNLIEEIEKILDG